MTALSRLLTVRADMRDPDAAAEVTPDALAAYAERTGWTLLREDADRRVYERGTDALHVPCAAGWPAYGRAVLEELAILATAEDRGSLAVWAEIVGLADCRSVDAPSRALQTPPHPVEPPKPSQAALWPTVARPRRTTAHRWGMLSDETAAHPFRPGETVPARVQTCRHCGARRRRANTGRRLGAEDMYQADGAEWTHAVPSCKMKR